MARGPHDRPDASKLTEVAARVYAALKAKDAYGAAKPVIQSELAKLAGTNSRVLQWAQLQLIEQGVPVCSTCGSPPGVFIATTLTELQAYGANLHSRIVGNAWRLKGVRKMTRDWLDRLEIEPSGQRRLFA